jgi:hypothetical protein
MWKTKKKVNIENIALRIRVKRPLKQWKFCWERRWNKWKKKRKFVNVAIVASVKTVSVRKVNAIVAIVRNAIAKSANAKTVSVRVANAKSASARKSKLLSDRPV